MPDFFISNIIPFIENLQQMAYAIVFFAALAETTLGIGLIIPGSSLILIVGAFSANNINIWGLILFAASGAFLGDNLNYYLGEKYGSRWIKNGVWIITPEMIKNGKTFFDKHGCRSVFMGRFIPTIKEIIPFIAGTIKMKYKTFLFWNTLGAIGWAMEWIFAGYIFAQSIELAKEWLSRTGFFVAILFLIMFITYVIKTILIKKGEVIWKIFSKQITILYKKTTKIPFIKKISKKYPRSALFIKKRFTIKSFTGLRLTFLTLLSFYIIFLIATSITNQTNTNSLNNIADTRILNFIPFIRSELLTTFFLYITNLAKSKIILLFLVNTIFLFLIWNKKRFIVPITMSVTGASVSTYIIKNIIQRPRPQTALYLEHSYSFPSGHATMSIAFYGFLAYFFIRNTKRTNKKVNIFFTFIILIFTIGLSRIYLGVHYPSDILCGYLIGTLWLLISITLTEWTISKEKNSLKKFILSFLKFNKKIKHKYFLTLLSLALSAVGYIHYSINHQINLLPASSESKLNEKYIHEKDLFKKINTHTETLFAKKAQPINIIILSKNDQNIYSLFKGIEWTIPSDLNINSLALFLKTKLNKDLYTNIPLSPSFYNGDINNFAFEKVYTNDLRYFVRIWKTNLKTNEDFYIYVGTISADNGIKWLLVHKMNPNIDMSRKYLYSQIKSLIPDIIIEEYNFIEPETGQNFSKDNFYTDGKVLFIKFI